MIDFAQLEAHRAPLTGHCYRMLGSAFDAEDAVQDTLIRAWQSRDRFEGRSSLRTWLYRIATNVCLDALSSRGKRMRPMEDGPLSTVDDELTARPRQHWLEPIPDERALPADADPSERLMLRQSIRLAFVAALQHLPPRQRAALLLTEVLGWSASEVADSLDMSVAAVNSALQRARGTLERRNVTLAPQTLSDVETKLLEQYVSAFEQYNVDHLVNLLREDATLSMPPYTLWLQGRTSIGTWLAGRGSGCRGSRLIATAANGLPAFGQYRPGDQPGTWRPWGLIVLELAGGRIASWNSFLDVETFFPLFGLPPSLTQADV